jgi:hypothetical protein
VNLQRSLIKRMNSLLTISNKSNMRLTNPLPFLLRLGTLMQPEIRTSIFDIQADGSVELQERGIAKGFECCEVEIRRGGEVGDRKGDVLERHCVLFTLFEMGCLVEIVFILN